MVPQVNEMSPLHALELSYHGTRRLIVRKILTVPLSCHVGLMD